MFQRTDKSGRSLEKLRGWNQLSVLIYYVAGVVTEYLSVESLRRPSLFCPECESSVCRVARHYNTVTLYILTNSSVKIKSAFLQSSWGSMSLGLAWGHAWVHILLLYTLCLHPFLFLPAYPPPYALMSRWASSKDIHYRNTELIPPLNPLLSLFSLSLPPPLTYSPNPTLFFFFLLFTLLSKISHSRAQGRGGLWNDGSHFCPALEKSSSFVQAHSIIFPESHEESQRSHE